METQERDKEEMKWIDLREYLVDTDWFLNTSWTFNDHLEVTFTSAIRVNDELGFVTDTNSVLLNATASHVALLGVDRYKTNHFRVFR